MIEIVNLLLAVIMTMYVLLQFRKEELRKAVVCAGGFFVLSCYLDRICYLVMAGIADGSVESQGIYLVGILVSKGMMGTLIFVGRGFMSAVCEEDSHEKNHKLTFVEGQTLAASVFFLAMLIGIRGIAAFMVEEFGFLLILFLVLCFYYVSTYIHYQRELRRQLVQQKEAEKKKTDNYLYTIESNYQRTRELWHDLKNHIGLLDLLLWEKKYSEMKDYLRIFNEEVDGITLPAKSGNLIVDAVLADKIAQARKEGIIVSLELCDFSNLFLKPDEICSLLGNLLDNAIEACRQVEQDKRIWVQCKVQEGCYYISVKNTSEKRVMDTERHYISTKKDMTNGVGHGLGLRSVERVVNRYQGDLLVDSRTEEFIVVIRLPR